jgi:acyl-CoA thioester hydrolase
MTTSGESAVETQYTIEMSAEDQHIDFQGIMDGLYYPYYMEKCRHQFAREVLGFDLEALAAEGVNVVLSQYLLRFRRPLRRGDRFAVTCSAHPDAQNRPRIHLKQSIFRDGKAMADAVFTATFVAAKGGRSFLPDGLAEKISGEPFDSTALNF